MCVRHFTPTSEKPKNNGNKLHLRRIKSYNVLNQEAELSFARNFFQNARLKASPIDLFGDAIKISIIFMKLRVVKKKSFSQLN